MSELIEELRKLQEIEVRLAEIRRDRESRERRAESRRRLAQKAEERLDAARRTARERQIRLDSLQLDLASREESIGRHRQALNKAKTNKEYAAILTAMNTEKADNTKIESGMIEIIKEIDAAKATVQQIESEKEKLLKDASKAEADLADFDRASRQDKTQLEDERGTHTKRIPPAAMEAFSRAASRHEGEAMAAVARARPKQEDYTCAGCNMKVTLEIVNALATRDEVRICGSCARILYLEPSVAKR